MIVLAVRNDGDRTTVTVAPITHAPPERADLAIEIPAETKRRLGLDGERSWIIAADLNRFVWPGVDVRPTRRGSNSYAFGLLPPAIYRELRDKVLALARVGRAALTARGD